MEVGQPREVCVQLCQVHLYMYDTHICITDMPGAPEGSNHTFGEQPQLPVVGDLSQAVL